MLFPKTLSISGNMPFAQNELARYLAAMTGTEIRPDGYPFAILANQTKDEGYRVEVTEQRTVIQADSPRAAVYGVYGLLERLGAQFLAEDCEILPQITDWEPMCFSSRPDFAYRDLYWRGALDGRFALQCRLNSARADIAPEMDGKVSFYRYSHTFEELVPPEKWFDSHPEYFSLVNGKRRREHSQLCLTNPDVLEICIEGVRRWMREHPECRIFSVAQNDWYGYCECEHCQAIDRREESHAGALLAFVNAVADAVRDEFPDNRIHTFAYLYSRKAPRFLRPRENVIVRLCSIECCQSHPMGACRQAIGGIDVENNAADAFALSGQAFTDDLADWAKIAPHLYLWDYTTNFSNYLQPFPNWHVMGENLRLFRRLGVEGVLEQGNYSPGKTSAFAPLRIYLLSRLLWNADADTDELIRTFVQGYYGPEAETGVLQCLSLMEGAASQNHMGIYDMPDAPYLEEALLIRADAALADALRRTADPIRRERLERERLSFEYVQLARLPLDAPGRNERIDAFAERLSRLGVTELFERRELAGSLRCMKESRFTRQRDDVPYRCYRL